MTNTMTNIDLYRFVRQSKLAVLGTVNAAGSPQSALVGVAFTTNLEIIFDTVKTSRKYSNLMANPACSFAIGWAGEQTVQFEGEASELAGDELEIYRRVYFEAWPDGPARMSWPGIVYFVVRPRWVRYSAFDRTPPLIQEFQFPGT